MKGLGKMNGGCNKIQIEFKETKINVKIVR